MSCLVATCLIYLTCNLCNVFDCKSEGFTIFVQVVILMASAHILRRLSSPTETNVHFHMLELCSTYFIKTRLYALAFQV